MSEWISVEERLPEDAGYVLVAVRNASWPTVGWYNPQLGWYVIGWRWDGLGLDNHADVTHWMPLPKMPEGQHEI